MTPWTGRAFDSFGDILVKAVELRHFPFAAAAVLLAAGAGCRAQTVSRPPQAVLRLAAAYAPFSEPLAAEYRRALPQLNIQPFASSGSPDVIRGIETNAADMGVASADDVYEAY